MQSSLALVSRHVFVLCLLASVLWLADGSLTAAQDGEPQPPFQAGASLTNITPPLGELIVGGWKPLPANEIHDELHARCLVLDDGTDRIAIVLCDNVGIPREVFEEAKKRIEAITKIPASHQLMASTHTHSATTARGENFLISYQDFSSYQTFLIGRIVDAVRLANGRLQPADIGWGSIDEPSEVFNRRWLVHEEDERTNPFGGVDQVRTNPASRATLIRPAGPVDPEVSYLSVRTKDGQPIALLANYSLHYVGGIPSRVVSADYFGVFANHLSALLNTRQDGDSPFVAMLSNGTSGDVNNINFPNRGPARQPYEKMGEVGELIAERVSESLANVRYRTWVDLSAAETELDLAVRKPSPKLLASMREVAKLPDGEQRYHRHEKIYAERLEQLVEAPASISVPLQFLKIGDLGIHAIPFEVFTEIGLELKERCPLPDSFTIELAGGSFGYLPTPEHHELGGYETWMGTSRVEKDASTQIVERLLELADSITGDADKS